MTRRKRVTYGQHRAMKLSHRFEDGLTAALASLQPLPEELRMFGARSLDDLTTDQKIDVLELALIRHPEAIELPVSHRFTPGLYIRELTAPPGTLATTYIHRQEHPFVVSAGEVSVYDGEKVVRVRAPFSGITKAGTRRICYVHAAAVWTTFHPTKRTTVDEVEEELYEYRTLPDGTNVRDRFLEAVRAKELAP